MFLITQLLVKIEISRSPQLWFNLVLQLWNSVNLVLSTKFSYKDYIHTVIKLGLNWTKILERN